MTKPSAPILALGLMLAISGALFAQSRERRSDRAARSYSSSGSAGPSGPMTNGTNPGFTTESPKPGKPLPGDYAILGEKSIFEKDRRITRENFPTETHIDTRPIETSRPSARPPAIPVFLGVMIGDDGLVGYIEDPDNGAIWPLAPNDPLPAPYGTVKSITLDEMQITLPDGQIRHILSGQNLAGDAPVAPSSSSSSSSSSSAGAGGSTSQPDAATTGPAIDPNSPNLTIEQRMKLRRQQQLGK